MASPNKNELFSGPGAYFDFWDSCPEHFLGKFLKNFIRPPIFRGPRVS